MMIRNEASFLVGKAQAFDVARSDLLDRATRALSNRIVPLLLARPAQRSIMRCAPSA